MMERSARWVAAVLIAVSVLVPGPRGARAAGADLWTATVEDLATSAPASDAAAAPVRLEPLGARAKAPRLTPNAGVFDGPVEVRCKTSTRRAVIRYTTNGRTPTLRSRRCRGKVLVDATTTLKARAFKPGRKPSRVSKAVIMIAPPAAGDTQTFDVQWKALTTLVDKTQLGMLLTTDPANRRYVLDAQQAADAGLDLSVGRVLVVYGIDFGTIASSAVVGSTVVVTLDAATLADAISDGTIDWDLAVPLSADRVQFVGPSGPFLAARPPAGERGALGASQPVVIKFKHGQFEYEITASLVGSAADLDIVVKKPVASKIVSRYVVKAHLEGYRSRNHLLAAGGQLTEWDSGVDGLKGDATLKLVVAGSGNDLGYSLSFPVMKVPFLIGPIPASLNIGAKFVVNASVPFDGSAGVETKFTYDSDVGLGYGGTTMQYSATMADYTIGDPPSQPYAGSSSQMAATFGIGFPEIGLSVGAGIEAGAWFRPGFVLGASWTAYGTPIPACLSADAEFLGAVGYDVTVFGFECNLLSGSKTVFDYKKPLLRAGQCPP